MKVDKTHSVLLIDEKCEGCTSCVKNCPTKAIRVKDGKAMIKEEYCIDCGECIRSCEYHAKDVLTEKLDVIKDYEYSIALLPPSFYGQFTKDTDYIKIISELKDLGFSQIWDVALGAEALSKATKDYLKEDDKIIISSSCPVIVRLIQLLYPELIEYLSPFKSPVEIVGQRARDKVAAQYKVEKKDIGIFFITPCPAKMSAIKNPIGIEESSIDGAIGVDIIYHKVIKNIDKGEVSDNDTLQREVPYRGISWAKSSGEIDLLDKENTLSISGIHNVISILEELDRGDISGVSYLEMVACEPGCVGGVLNVKNPFLAKFNIEEMLKKNKKADFIPQNLDEYDIKLPLSFKEKVIKPLGEDLISSMKKLTKLEDVTKELPGLDCAACGAPDCRTLAEDIVNKSAHKSDCVFILRKQVAYLADEMSRLTRVLPPAMQREIEEDD